MTYLLSESVRGVSDFYRLQTALRVGVCPHDRGGEVKPMRSVDEVIEALKDGEIRQVKVFDSSAACLQPCLGYHEKIYIEFRDKFYMVITGAHHALPVDFFGRPVWRREKEITEEEAKDWIERAINTDSIVVYR